jgi:hypothetical protein
MKYVSPGKENMGKMGNKSSKPRAKTGMSPGKPKGPKRGKAMVPATTQALMMHEKKH